MDEDSIERASRLVAKRKLEDVGVNSYGNLVGVWSSGFEGR